jgi:hypothetical protein
MHVNIYLHENVFACKIDNSNFIFETFVPSILAALKFCKDTVSTANEKLADNKNKQGLI